jgi:hypothetical protein
LLLSLIFSASIPTLPSAYSVRPVLASFPVSIAIAAFVPCLMLMTLVFTFSMILVLASSFMPMMVLIPQVGTLLSLCCPGSPLRVGVLDSVLTHVFRRHATRLPMLTNVSHSVMTTLMSAATLTRHRRIAIRQNNTHQQYRQTFMHARSPLVLIKLFFIDDSFNQQSGPKNAGTSYSLQTHFFGSLYLYLLRGP